MKKLIPFFIILAVLVGGYFALSRFRSRQEARLAANYQTELVERGSLTDTVGATGIVGSNQETILNWGTTGIVSEVLAQIGDQVQAGQELALLDQDSLPQNVILAQIDLINAQKALDDLTNSDVAMTKALQAIYAAQQGVIDAQRVLEQFDDKAFKDTLDKARQDVVDMNDDLEQAREDFEPYKDWDEDNDVRNEYEQKLTDAQNDYDEAVRKVNELELRHNQAIASLEAAQAILTDSQREYEHLKDGPHPDDLAGAEARVAAARATLDLAKAIAPFDGTVTDVSNKVGDRVSVGAPAFRLDDLSKLLVDVQVSEVDIDRIQPGQDAKLTFDAIPGKEYNGVVSEVSPVGTNIQGIVEFFVVVELIDADQDIKPGMTAAVNIVADQLDDVVLVPNRAVRVIDGQRVVYVLRDGELDPVKISLGASSDTYSEVSDGELRLGDTVVLNPPQFFDTNGPPPFVNR